MAGTTIGRLTLASVAVIFLGLVFAAQGKPTSLTNSTITVDKNDPRLYCEKSSWYDVCWFVFSNYVLHALSVRSLPGENNYSTTAFKLCCLLIPYTGLRRGLCLISRASNLAGNDLQSAARANALCMIIRTPEWRPRNGDIIDGCEIHIVDTAEDQVSLSKATTGFLSRIRTWETIKSTKSAKSAKSADIKSTSVDVEKELKRSDSTVAQNAWRYRNHLKLETKDLYQRSSCQNAVEKIARVLIETYRFATPNPTNAIVNHERLKLQGYCELVPGYALCYIPPDMKVYPRYTSRRMTGSACRHPLNNMASGPENDNSAVTRIASAHNVPRVLFSIGQTVSGGYALYKARGPQIERYGFAAFGLTVIPYILISIVNFFGALLTSEYETIFLVHSSIMDEMIERGGRSDGVVGTMHPPTDVTDEVSSSSGNDKREERVENLSKKRVVFDEQDGSLRCCYDDKSEPCEPHQTYQIYPYEPRVVKPKGRKLPRRGWRSWICRIGNHLKWPAPYGQTPPWASKSKQKQKQKVLPRSTISIPSHPAFTRLRRPKYQIYNDMFCIGLLFTAVVAPYLIIWLLSGFKVKQSTNTQRNLVLQWLICGQVHGYLVGDVERLTTKSGAMKGLLYTFLFYGCYFLGGFVIVAEEMVEYGDCKSVS